SEQRGPGDRTIIHRGRRRPRSTLYHLHRVQGPFMRRSYWIASLIVLVAFLSGAVAAAAFTNRTDPVGLWLLQSVIERVQGQSLDTAVAGNAYESAARGLLEQLDDPYAELFSPDEIKSFQRETIGNR